MRAFIGYGRQTLPFHYLAVDMLSGSIYDIVLRHWRTCLEVRGFRGFARVVDLRITAK